MSISAKIWFPFKVFFSDIMFGQWKKVGKGYKQIIESREKY